METGVSRRGPHLARSVGIVMAGFVVSKIVGLGREMVVAGTFGTGPELDAYYAAFGVPDLLFTLIAGGALASAFIPVFSGYLARRDTAGAWRLASAVTNLVFLVVAVIAVLMAWATPALVSGLIAPGFSAAQQQLTVRLIYPILLSTLIFSVSGIVMGILNAHQHFLLPAFAPAFYNLGIILGALFLTPWLGVYGLAVGVVLGAGLHLVVQVPGLIHYGGRYTPGFASPGLSQVVWLMWPRMLALGVVKLNFLIANNLASRLGEGSVSALNFGWLAMQLPETIIGTAVAKAVFPTLAELDALEERAALRRTLSGALRAILTLTIPAAAGLIVLGRPLVRLLFERGAFGTASTEAVYWALAFYALGLVGHSSLEVVARFFYAQKDTITPLFAARVAMQVNILLSLALLGPLGHGGLALANSLAVSLEVVILLGLAHVRMKGIEGKLLLSTAGRSLLAAVVMALVLRGFTVWQRGAGPLVLGLGGAGLGLAVYLGVALALGSEEIRVVMSVVRRRLKHS